MEFKAELNKIPLRVEDGSYILSFNLGKDAHIAYEIYEQYMKAPVKVKIEKYREKRSDEANRMFWSYISRLAEALGVDNWEMYIRELKKYGKYTALMVKQDAFEDFKKLWRTVEIVGERVDQKTNEKYYDVLCFYGSSQYNSKEFARLLSGVIEDLRDMGLDTEEYISNEQSTEEN